MSYIVTILRTQGPTGLPLSLSEIQAVAQSLGGWSYTERNRTFVRQGPDGEICTLFYKNGELWAKTPSEWGLAQMITLAAPLQARVRGDDFETYTAPDSWFLHPDDIQPKQEAARTNALLLKKHKREQQIIRLVIIGFFALLGALGYIVGKSFEK